MRFLETQNGRDLANQLIRVGAIHFASTKSHRSHKKPVYFNLEVPHQRMSELPNGYLCKALGLAFINLAEEHQIRTQTVCGIPNEGQSLAYGMIHMDRSKLSPVCIRHGEDRGQVHDKQASERVLLVDDVIVDGKTKIEAIQTLRDCGYVIEHLFVVIDGEQEGVRRVSDIGVVVHALYGVQELKEHYIEHGFIDPKTLSRISNQARPT